MITSVPTGYAIDWIKASMKVAERNYSLCLACGLFFVILHMFVSFIPFIGSIAGVLLLFLFYSAQIKFVKRVLNKEEVNFEQYLQLVFNPEIFNKHMPYVIVCAVSGLLATSFVIADSAATSFYVRGSGLLVSIGGLWNLINVILACLCAFAVDLKDNDPSLDWQSALRRAFAGVWQNIVPWFLVGVIMAIFAFVTMILCVLPFFLYFVPMTFPCLYLVYASIFEGLNIEQITEEWRKPVTPLNS